MDQRRDRGAETISEQAWERDARLQREHEIELAKVQADERQNKRQWWLGVLFGIAVLIGIAIFVGGIVGAIVYVRHQDAQKQIQIERTRSEAAQACIREGNIWYNGQCLIARKPS